MNYSNITNCRLCKSPDLEVKIENGKIALANSYLDKPNGDELKVPLTLLQCTQCGHIQLRETVDPKILFSHYLYSSSTSPALVEHFRRYVSSLIVELGLDEFSQIVEIGMNDGVLLSEFEKKGIGSSTALIGIDAASNLCEIAARKGNFKIYNTFFNLEVAKTIRQKHGTANLICTNNTFAHIDCLDSVVDGIKHLLADEGICIIENAYILDTLKGLYFDQQYHEHLQYYSILALHRYLDDNNLRIYDVSFNNIQGGSFRIFVQHKFSGKLPISLLVEKAINNEIDQGLFDGRLFDSFFKQIQSLKRTMERFLIKAGAEGKTISAYGCAAKFALFSKFFGLNSENVKFVVDDSPLKQGKFSPETRIPIVSRQHFIENPTDFCIISAWNFEESIRSRNPQYGGKWIVPLPEFKII